MRVRMLTTMAGPDVDTRNAGAVVEDMDDARARELVDGGYAIEVDDHNNPVRVVPATKAELNELDRRRQAVEDDHNARLAQASLSPAALPVSIPAPPAQGMMRDDTTPTKPQRPATVPAKGNASDKTPAQPEAMAPIKPANSNRP